MGFVPLARMWERIQRDREDSDTTLLNSLLYAGESISKVVTATLVATLPDDKERNRYRHLHKLVRADGLGDWNAVLDEVIIGPLSQSLPDSIREEQQELTQRHKSPSWQYESVKLMRKCLRAISPDCEDLRTKVAAREWLGLFTRFRNKTRGHGAISGSTCGLVCPDLLESLKLFSDNFTLFQRQWAYLHRNLSGKYRVSSLSDVSDHFQYLKSDASRNFADGVYVFLDTPILVELIRSDVEASDFFLPNGGFNDNSFELLSYQTGNVSRADSGPYLAPVGPLPRSETQGIGQLDVQGECFGNLPAVPRNYVKRDSLEKDLVDVLSDDRHPIVTLHGSGGIGKTWLALSALHQLTLEGSYGAIVWLSARDVDLIPSGPKSVKPHVLTERDIAKEFVRLMCPEGTGSKGFNELRYMENSFEKSPIDQPILYVVDNFETVKSPGALYSWLDTYIRLPNKVLITTRFRDFKGDYPVEVPGMSYEESGHLIEQTARQWDIRDLITVHYVKELFEEAEGHPYVMKVMLGEVAKAKKLVTVRRVVASRDEVLEALFERTYQGLRPAAKLALLTLCLCSTVLPRIAVEGVLSRPELEKLDAEAAIEDLIMSSFVEVAKPDDEDSEFLAVPLAAQIFGRKKLAASPLRRSAEASARLLRLFGHAQKSGIRHGMEAFVRRFFGETAKELSKGDLELVEIVPVLEYVARKFPLVWKLLSTLYEEVGGPTWLQDAKNCLARFLESFPADADAIEAWKQSARLCEKTQDWKGAVSAWCEISQYPIVPYHEISAIANKVNQHIRHFDIADPIEKKAVIESLVSVMERRLDEASATDCSRLAWMCLNAQDVERAKRFVEAGLEREKDNPHCVNVAERLGIAVWER